MRLEELYGVVQQGPDAEMYRLHDNTVAESIKLINDLKNYAFKQEKNAQAAFLGANKLSPKGCCPHECGDKFASSPRFGPAYSH